MRRYILFFITSLLIAFGLADYALQKQYANTDTGLVMSFDSPLPTANVKVKVTASPVPTALPATVSLTVPYTMQAPYNVWDPLHEDACEETSLIMVKHFLDGTTIATQAQADQEIRDMIAWEGTHGYGPSITLAQLNQIAADYYGLHDGKVVTISSVDDLKAVVAAGHPAILGMAGKLLPNPYFSNGGPNYHMLVAKGYDATGFIANEPGTFHGDGFHYNYDVFYNAIHDWNAQDILQGQKAYLAFGA